MSESKELLDEIQLPDARGRRREEPIEFEVVRSLTEADLPAILQPATSPLQELKEVRHVHHQLARLMVQGKPDQEISFIMGYSPSYLSNLRRSPAFCELLDHYKGVKDQAFVDVMERMKVLQITTLEELQKRLSEEPEGWTKRELMELAELLKDGNSPGGRVPPGGPSVQVNVQFVKPAEPTMIDVTPEAK